MELALYHIIVSIITIFRESVVITTLLQNLNLM